jgi:hypothetical protein
MLRRTYWNGFITPDCLLAIATLIHILRNLVTVRYDFDDATF